MELRNPTILAVAVVDRPANRRPFTQVSKTDGRVDYQSYLPFQSIEFDKAEGGDRVRVSGISYYAGSPSNVDSQGDWASAEAVKQMESSWRENGSKINLQHKVPLSDQDVRVLSSTISTQGNWILSAEFLNPDVVDAVRKGRLTGWSIEGRAECGDCTDAQKAAQRTRRTPEPYERIEDLMMKNNNGATAAELRALLAQAREAAALVAAIPSDELSPEASARIERVLDEIAAYQAANAEPSRPSPSEVWRERQQREQEQTLKEYAPFAYQEQQEQLRLQREYAQEVRERKKLEQARERAKYGDDN